jgi:hypothetical protein
MTPTMVSVFNCSLRSLRIALGIRLLRRHSQTKSTSASFSSARRRAIQGLMARSAYFMDLGGYSAPAATGAAAIEPVDIDEVDTYVLIASQRADYRTQSSCCAA